MRSRRALTRSAVLALSFLAAAVCAAPAQPGGKEKAPLTTITYNVADLIHRPGGKSGFAGIDDLIKVVTEQNPKLWRHDNPAGNFIQEVNGHQLEVRAAKAVHTQIKQLLDALRRRWGVAVKLRAELYEVDRTWYEKEIRPELPSSKSPAVLLDVETARLIRAKGTLVKSGQALIAEGKTVSFFSLRRAFTYVARVPEVYATGFEGVTVRATARVTPDRRAVRLKLTQKVTELADVDRQAAFAPTGEEGSVEIPYLNESSTSSAVEVADGDSVLLPIRYLPRAAAKRGRTWVMVLRPIIYIEEEEKALRDQGK